MKTKKIVIAALLVGLSIVVPYLSLPVVPIPEFSVTLFAHVPVMLGMLISPTVGVMAAIGSALGFFFKGMPPVVAMRALSHVLFALVGGYMMLKLNSKYAIVYTFLVTLVLHVVAEVAVVALWFQTSTINAALTVGAPVFALHHTFDFIMSVIIFLALQKAKLVEHKLSFKN